MSEPYGDLFDEIFNKQIDIVHETDDTKCCHIFNRGSKKGVKCDTLKKNGYDKCYRHHEIKTRKIVPLIHKIIVCCNNK